VNEDPRQWATDVAQTFEELDLRWAVVGALAAVVYRAQPRATGDADLLTTWHDDLVGRLEAVGYEIKATTARGGDRPYLLRLKRGASAIDVMVVDSEYQEVALERSADDHLLTIEDVLIHKVLADRRRDQDDVASILSTSPDLDHEYLEEWMDAWGITELWEAAQARQREVSSEGDAGETG
jgi:hypothetical protein